MESDEIEVDLKTLDLLSYRQIQSALKRSGLSSAGNKKALIKRLRSELESLLSIPVTSDPGLRLRAKKSDV